LDLTGDTSVSNEPDTAALAFHNRTNNYRAGVTLDLPIDRVAERNSYRRSLIALERAQRSYVSTKEDITAGVRDSLRGIRSAEINVEIQRRGIDLDQRRMDNANTLLQQGRIGNRDVVEAQNSLLSAQDAYEQARGQLQIRVLEYMRDTGTLRVDPKAGTIGRAMDRRALQATQTAQGQ
jgi:outer membrane protein TolC